MGWIQTDFLATEPTLGISSKGTLFYAASNGQREDPAAPIFRSTDAGETWTEVTPRLLTGQRSPPYPVDPFIHYDAVAGRLFTINMHEGRDCAFLHWSDDDGETWTLQPEACGTPPLYDHQSLATGIPRTLRTTGYPNVVYQCMNRVSDSSCARSLDGGWTWTATAVPFLGVDLNGKEGIGNDFICGGLHGHVIVAPDGVVVLPKNQCGRPMVAISRDDGLSWRAQEVSDVTSLRGPDPSVAADTESNLYFVFQDQVGSLLLTTSTDGGNSWSKEIQLTHPPLTGHFPAVAVAGPGRIVVQSLGTLEVPNGFQHPDMLMERGTREEGSIVNRALWHGFLTFVDDALSPTPTIRTFKVNPDDDPLVRGDCDARYCATEIGDFQDVVIGPHGTVFAAFVDRCVDTCVEPSATYHDNDGNRWGAPAALAVVPEWPAVVAQGLVTH